MEQIIFIFKRLTHLAIAVLAIVSVVFSMLASDLNRSKAAQKEYDAQYAAFGKLWGKRIHLEVIQAVADISPGYPAGIMAKVKNTSPYPINASGISCPYQVASEIYETKVRNGVEVREPKYKPRDFVAHSADEFYRIEPGQTVVLNYKADFGGVISISMKEFYQRVKLGNCYGGGNVGEYDAIRIVYQQPKP